MGAFGSQNCFKTELWPAKTCGFWFQADLSDIQYYEIVVLELDFHQLFTPLLEGYNV